MGCIASREDVAVDKHRPYSTDPEKNKKSVHVKFHEPDRRKVNHIFNIVNSDHGSKCSEKDLAALLREHHRLLLELIDDASVPLDKDKHRSGHYKKELNYQDYKMFQERLAKVLKAKKCTTVEEFQAILTYELTELLTKLRVQSEERQAKNGRMYGRILLSETPSTWTAETNSNSSSFQEDVWVKQERLKLEIQRKQMLRKFSTELNKEELMVLMALYRKAEKKVMEMAKHGKTKTHDDKQLEKDFEDMIRKMKEMQKHRTPTASEQDREDFASDELKDSRAEKKNESKSNQDMQLLLEDLGLVDDEAEKEEVQQDVAFVRDIAAENMSHGKLSQEDLEDIVKEHMDMRGAFRTTQDEEGEKHQLSVADRLRLRREKRKEGESLQYQMRNEKEMRKLLANQEAERNQVSAESLLRSLRARKDHDAEVHGIIKAHDHENVVERTRILNLKRMPVVAEHDSISGRDELTKTEDLDEAKRKANESIGKAEKNKEFAKGASSNDVSEIIPYTDRAEM